jgi:excisionase family DNA binding protein
MKKDDLSGLATVPEAAKFLNMSRTALYGLMDRGDLRYCKIGKIRRVPWSELQKLVRKSLVEV